MPGKKIALTGRRVAAKKRKLPTKKAAQPRRGTTRKQAFEPVGNLQDAALELLERGLPLVLCRPGSKLPISKGWQHKKWTKSAVKEAFRRRGALNVGLILGPRSGLIDFECDGPEGADALNELFDNNVPVAPTWQARRGPHRLFEGHQDLEHIGRASVTYGALHILLGAGGKGAQSLLPPSIADKYERTWKVSLDECDPPSLPDTVLRKLLTMYGGGGLAAQSKGILEHSIDVFPDVFQREGKSCSKPIVSQPARRLGGRKNSAVTATSPKSKTLGINKKVQHAINVTVPSKEGYRNHQIFLFARLLKAIPELTAASMADLEPYVDQWYEKALPAITTKDFAVTWSDFRTAWKKVKSAAGEGELGKILAAGLQDLPACAEGYGLTALVELVALCCELQRRAGMKSFWLSVRAAAATVGVPTTKAHKLLWRLMHDSVIERVKVGVRGRASEYNFTGDM